MLRFLWSEKFDHLRLVDLRKRNLYISWFPPPDEMNPSDFSRYQYQQVSVSIITSIKKLITHNSLVSNLPSTFLNARRPAIELSSQELKRLQQELESTWAIVFATNRGLQDAEGRLQFLLDTLLARNTTTEAIFH